LNTQAEALVSATHKATSRARAQPISGRATIAATPAAKAAKAVMRSLVRVTQSASREGADAIAMGLDFCMSGRRV
jgi:hypothetical protein